MVTELLMGQTSEQRMERSTTLLPVNEVARVNASLRARQERPTADARRRQVSEARARAVAAWLVKAGVPADAVRTAAHGYDWPAVQGTDWVSRARNNRVTFAVEVR
jgi:outer membrane protein OmpA-like peptidoglycan-associated protein